MSPIVISVENLSKVYRLGQIGTGTLTNDLRVWWATRVRHQPNPLLKIGQADHGNRAGEDLYALRDVSFTVEQGEVLGIIGRNGAGKSTLLKILSRVTAPTSGEVKVKGRIASLLEVGTGFHPELTGRENIYLNGAILGMSKAEIARKFDEIVAFAEIEKFLDTPVKRYSSGMYVRLAFAVAAHLEPEILVVDEVLAVGDAAFQKKCLGKMGDVAKEGRTVLFVSHNMAAVTGLCSRGILLEFGKVIFAGEASVVIGHYLQNAQDPELHALAKRTDWSGNGSLRIRSVEIRNGKDESIAEAISGGDIRFALNYETSAEMVIRNVAVALTISNIWGQSLITCWTEFTRQTFESVSAFGTIMCDIPHFPLIPGFYWVNISVRSQNQLEYRLDQAFSFSVIGGDFFGTGQSPKQNVGPNLVIHSWRLVVS